MRHTKASEFSAGRTCFAQWLIEQHKREDSIGELARCARRDPQFPSHGDVMAVSKRLNQLEADPDMHVALEDAELDWAAI